MIRSLAARTRMALWLAPACLALAAAPALASHEDDHGPALASTWESAADGGTLTDDVARHSTHSRSLNNSVETHFVTGIRLKPDASIEIGIDDWDAVTTAFDAVTGAVRWTAVYDAGVNVDDEPKGIEVDWNNNIVHVVVQSGDDVNVVTYAVSSGNELSVTPLADSTAHATSIRMAGFYVGIAGQQDGRFFFTTYESGPQAFTIDSAPVVGEAFAVATHNKTRLDQNGDPEWGFGSLASTRTFVATGRVGAGSSDVYTAAFLNTHSLSSPLWSQTWNGPDDGEDVGLVVETGWVGAESTALAWTAARSQDASGDWDVVIRAHDIETGAPAWSGDTRSWGGSGDETPVAMWYADATQTLYVTGTSDRGSPHGTDVFTLAYDGFSGALKGEAFSSGNVANGIDAATDVTATHDGQRVFVSAEIEDEPEGGSPLERAGFFAFETDLSPTAGVGLFSDGEGAAESAVGVAIDIFQGFAVVGGSSDPVAVNGQDLAAASFDLLPEPALGVSLAAGAALVGALARRRRGEVRAR